MLMFWFANRQEGNATPPRGCIGLSLLGLLGSLILVQLL